MKLTYVLSMGIGVLATLLSACGNHETSNANTTIDSSASATANPEKTVRIATESNYKPFSYINAEGEHEGFEIDLIHALCQQMQANCVIASHDWDSLIPGLQANKYDAIFASMSATDERRKVVNFSDPYFNNKLVLVGQADDNTTMATVGGKDVAVQQATVAAQYLHDHYPKAVTRVYDKQVNAYLDLKAGRVHLLLSDVAPALDWLKTPDGQGFAVKDSIDINDNVAIAMRQEDTQLASEFNAALATLKQNGAYDTLVAKYFEKDALSILNTPIAVPAGTASDATIEANTVVMPVETAPVTSN